MGGVAGVKPGGALSIFKKARSLLRIEKASVHFAARDGRPVHALDNVSLDIANGALVVALGKSGCGKSTLLNAMAGFLPLSSGSITLNGRSVEGPGAERGVVFQKDTAAALEERGGECRAWAEICGCTTQRAARAGARSSAARRSSGLRRRRALRTLRRHAPARRHCARARARSRDPAHGRAVRRSRQHDAGSHAGTACRRLGADRQADLLHHPFDRRGAVSRHASHRDVAAAGAHRGALRSVFVHAFARDRDARAAKTAPEFAALREEIRAIVHQNETSRSAAQ